MLYITVPITPEGYDEVKGEFVEPKVQMLQLEHSLVSLSKWESKWNKPFLSKIDKTDEETLDYIKCMTLTQNVNSDVYNHLTVDNVRHIQEYINAPMTATSFTERAGGPNASSSELITAELIYYWMIALQIPFDPCQKWHINRLLTLIRVCNVKNQPAKKMTRRETASRYADLNAARRKRLNTKG